MNEETPIPDIDWHRLSSLSCITWEDLVSVLFNLKLSYLENLPANCHSDHTSAAKAMLDLFEWIRSDCEAGKLECTNIDGENPSFPTNKIGRWLASNRVLVWLTVDRRVDLLFRAETIKFVEKIAYGHSAEPLKTNDLGEFDGKYYASLSAWTLLLALQILDKGNPTEVKKITEAMELSSRARDPLYHLMLIPPIEGMEAEAGLPPVYPTLFCMWAYLKGFHIPGNILEILEEKGMFEWAQKKWDEFAEFQEALKIKRAQKQETQVTIEAKQPASIVSNEAETERKDRLPSSPTTDTGKMATLHTQCVALFVERLKEKPTLKNGELAKDMDFKELIKRSGLSPSIENIKKKWVAEARGIASSPSKHGSKTK
jgi:hypothetical protein